jgi:Tfp pilus assembly protein PilV
MSIFVSNFFRRVADYLLLNRRRLIKWLLITVAGLASAGLLYYGVEAIHRARYEKQIQALEKQFQEADARAKQLKSEADALKRDLDAKQAQYQFLEAAAKAADVKLTQTRRTATPLKEAYEHARNDLPLPLPASVISCSDARAIVCSELAAAGHPCR